jgi:hypothetical protein
MFLQDLYLLAYDCAEIRTPLLHLKGEIFRKGFDDWKPKFHVKCQVCGKEYKEEIEECDKCGSASLRKPDQGQLEVFDKFKDKCNIFSENLATICQQFHDDLGIADDAFLHLHKQYSYINRQLWSKIIEVRRIHPALMEIDLDKNGLPKNSHWICPFHPDNVQIKPMPCKECGFEMLPAMYIYNHRGKRIYLLEDECVHRSKFSPSSTYGYCYDDQTQILTKQRGWQFFKDLNSSDEVATLNPQNNELVYQKPSTIWSQDYKGQMYEVKGDTCLSLKVTPNHKHYAKFDKDGEYGLIEAKDLFHKQAWHKIGGANWIGQEVKCFSLERVDFYRNLNWRTKHNDESDEINLTHYPTINISMDIWIEFMGYYLSEGNLTVEGGSGGQVCISQMMYSKGAAVKNTQINPKWLKIKLCLERLGMPYRYYGHKFIINDNRIHNYLKQFGHARDKFIPYELKQLSQRQLRILFEALMLGDGSWDYRNPTKGVYISSSPKLRDDISEIMLKLGYSVRARLNSIQVGFSTKDTYRGKKNSFNDSFVDYTGKIYCCEVPKYHVLLVRREGRTVFSGNSPILTIMQKVLTISGMDRFLYRYFFERKAPTGMILTYTDDPQSLEVERMRVEAKMMEDPTYIPWIAVSQKTGRGKTDFVRLFHTLQEMDYLNIRNEIRDRVYTIYQVPQMYMGVMEGVGGLSGQSQQMKMFSNVIESDQRMYNETIFPVLLQAFNVTDWEIRLRSPEEKIESVLLQQAQQKVGVALQMHGLGFDVALKSGAKDISTLDFVFSGKAMPLAPGGMPGGAIPIPSPGENEGQAVAPVDQKMLPEGFEQHGQHPPHLTAQPHWPDEKHRLEDIEYFDEDGDTI